MRVFLKIDKSVTLHAVDDASMRDAGFQEYHIHHPEHGKIGHVVVEHSNEFERGAGQGHQARIHIAMFRLNREHRGNQSLALGTMRALKNKYPTVKEVTGQRITGRHQGWVEHHFKSLVLLVRKAADRATAIRHVQALHAKAAATTFPAEAETFRAGAARLIAHHGIQAHELGGSAPKPETTSGYSAHDEGMHWRMNRQKEQHKDWHAKNAPWGSPKCPYCKEAGSHAGNMGKSVVLTKATGLGSRVLPMYMPRAVQHVPSGKVYPSQHKDDWHWDIWQEARKHHHTSEHADRSWSAGHIDPQTQVFREGPKHTYTLRKYIKFHAQSTKKSLMLVKANKLDSLTPGEEVLHSIRHNRRAMTHLEVADRLIEHIDDDPGSVVIEIAMSLAASYQENIHVLKHLDKVDQKLGDGLRKIYEVARQAEVIEQVIIKHLVTLGHAVENVHLRDAIANGIRGAIQITHAVDKALKAWAEKNDPERKKSLVLEKAVDQQKVEWMEHAHKALTHHGYTLQPKEKSTGRHVPLQPAESSMHTRLYQHVTRGHQVIIDMPHEGRPDWSFVHAHSWDKGNSGHKAENLEHHLKWVEKDDEKHKSLANPNRPVSKCSRTMDGRSPG